MAERDGIDFEDCRLLTTREMAELFGVHPRTIKLMRSARKLPAPIKIGPQTLRWRAAEIHDWLAAGCPDPSTWRWKPIRLQQLDALVEQKLAECRAVDEELRRREVLT